jgi:hypothetical protein
MVKTNGREHGFAAIGAKEYMFNLLSLINNIMKVMLQFFKYTY